MVSASPVLGINAHVAMPDISVDDVGVDSILHACKAGTLPTELSLKPIDSKVCVCVFKDWTLIFDYVYMYVCECEFVHECGAKRLGVGTGSLKLRLWIFASSQRGC